MKIGRKISLAPAPLNFGGKHAFHGAAENGPVPAGGKFLPGRQRQTELNQAAIEERVSSLNAERRAGFIRHLERMSVKRKAKRLVVILACRSRGRRIQQSMGPLPQAQTTREVGMRQRTIAAQFTEASV